MEAMKLYLKIRDPNSQPLESHSPFKVRQLLHKVLTVRDWASTEKYVYFYLEEVLIHGFESG